MGRRRIGWWLAGLSAALAAGSTNASDTITYTYDALGRLTNASVAGGAANGLQAATSYDPAGNRGNYSVAGASSGATAILSIDNVSVTEGGTAIFTVTKTGAAPGPISVNFGTADGTALAGADYVATSGSLTFQLADVTKTISVATIDDAAIESGESFTVILSGASPGVSVGNAIGSASIVDNDFPETPPVFSVANAASVAEGGTLVFTVSKAGSVSSSYSVNYATAGGTATSGVDFNATSGTLTFAGNESSKTVSVTTIDDSSFEPDESVLLNLSAPTGGATIGTAQASGLILNNDASPNQPPTTVADNLSMPKCSIRSINVVANDTDPEGNTPIVLIGVSGAGALGYASVMNSTSVQYEAYSSPGSDTITYTVRDSLGATSTGILHVTITQAVCQ